MHKIEYFSAITKCVNHLDIKVKLTLVRLHKTCKLHSRCHCVKVTQSKLKKTTNEHMGIYCGKTDAAEVKQSKITEVLIM